MEATYEIHCVKDQSITKTNVYLIVDKKSRKAAIVDPACRMEQIEAVLIKNGLKLEKILVTHTHFDHIRRVNELVDLYGCRVYVSKEEAEYYFFCCKNMCLFQDEDVIEMGATTIKCLVTPGHTRGSTCFVLKNSIFTGDTLFVEGCGICTYKGGSAKEMFQSMRRIKQKVVDSMNVYPGHTYIEAPGMTIEYVKENNIYYLLEDEKKFIEFRMRKNQQKLFAFK